MKQLARLAAGYDDEYEAPFTGWPGRAPVTARLSAAPGGGGGGGGAVVQRKADGPAVVDDVACLDLDLSGGSALPYASVIQQAFGKHDVSTVRAHEGDAARAASQAMGAIAFATGEDVVFRDRPDLHTAAHEAAHVVQQRAGIGADGDAYERHADAVAELVVRGESAEALLDQTRGGGATQVVQYKRDAGAAPAGDARAFDLQWKNMMTYHKGLFEKQKAALGTLAATAGKEDPPPVWKDLLVIAGTIALGATIGGVGGAVGRVVSTMLPGVLADTAEAKHFAAIMADAAKDAAKAASKVSADALGKSIDKKMRQYPEGDVERAAKICFEGQRDALIEGMVEAEVTLNTYEATLDKTAPAAVAAVKALADAAKLQYEFAEATQRTESVQQWAVYQAKTVHGVVGKGKEARTDLATVPGMYTEERGVLEVWGSMLDGQGITITRASMGGMNRAVRPDIAALTFAELKVPIKLMLEVGEEVGWVAKHVGKQAQPQIRLGRGEDGRLWIGPDSDSCYFLHRLGGDPMPEAMDDTGTYPRPTTEGAMKGAARVFERLGGMRPPLT